MSESWPEPGWEDVVDLGDVMSAEEYRRELIGVVLEDVLDDVRRKKKCTVTVAELVKGFEERGFRVVDWRDGVPRRWNGNG